MLPFFKKILNSCQNEHKKPSMPAAAAASAQWNNLEQYFCHPVLLQYKWFKLCCSAYIFSHFQLTAKNNNNHRPTASTCLSMFINKTMHYPLFPLIVYHLTLKARFAPRRWASQVAPTAVPSQGELLHKAGLEVGVMIFKNIYISKL